MARLTDEEARDTILAMIEVEVNRAGRGYLSEMRWPTNPTTGVYGASAEIKLGHWKDVLAYARRKL